MRRKQQFKQLVLAAALVGVPIGAAAQVTTEQGASIIVFPKVIADGTWDTVIQLANQTPNERRAHCFYVNGVPGPNATPLWAQIDFDVWLTHRQPTHWVVSQGRLDDPTNARCSADNRTCDGAGLDTGRVPPPPTGFRGELLCVEEDHGGYPVPGNAFVGKATLHHLVSGGVTTYNAIALHGFDTNNLDNTLCLGGGRSDACPSGAEYASCPDTWILNHPAEGAEDSVAGSGASATTTLTVVPCTQNLQAQVPQSVTLQFLIYNELEQRFSGSTTVTCWADVPLAAVGPGAFDRLYVGTDYLQTRIRVVSPSHGVMVVAQTFRASGNGEPLVTSTVVNVHSEGNSEEPDLITLPPMP